MGKKKLIEELNGERSFVSFTVSVETFLSMLVRRLVFPHNRVLQAS